MKFTLSLFSTEHNFEKTNLITVKGGGDNYACKCGLKGYRSAFQEFVVGNGKASLVAKCPLAKPKEITIVKKEAKKVRITNFTGHGLVFANLTKDSEHDVVDCPNEYRAKYANDVWVMGIGEAVRLLGSEYEEI